MSTAAIDWREIDTVFLDMDGTLLDLRFDNWFWGEHVTQHYAAARAMPPADAAPLLESKFRAARGTLDWYCIDHWSRELGLDIAGLKSAAFERIGYLPGAEQFLRRLKRSGKRSVLVTNAHPTTLAIKNARVGLAAHFDACYSTHRFAVPKENAQFWPRLQAAEPFVPARTLLIDDSVPVLDAAREFGIAWLRAVRWPDSGRPAQDTGNHPAIDRVDELVF